MADDNPVKVTGTVDFSAGVDSSKVPTVSSTANPNGLASNALAWLINATMRDGALSPRDGWQKLGNIVSVASLPALLGGMFQGIFEYVPTNGTPYKIMVINGHVIKVDPSFATAPVDLSVVSGKSFTGTTTKVYFVQAGIYLVIQSGNYNAATKSGDLPLIWNNVSLTVSNGITGVTQVGPNLPTTYTITSTAAWGVPNVGNNVNIFISSPYGGNVGDVVTISVASYSNGPDAGKTIGVFKIIAAITGGLTLQCLSVTGTLPGISGTPIPASDTPLIFSISIPPVSTQNVALAFTLLGSIGSGNLPNTGATGMITMGPGQYYPGTDGDVIIIQDGGTSSILSYYQVTAHSTTGTATVTLHNINAANSPGTIVVNFIVADWGNGDSPALGTVIPSNLALSVAIPFSSAYIGSVGDVVSIPVITNTGTVALQFKVLAFPTIAFPSWMAGIPVTLQPIASTGSVGPPPFNTLPIQGVFQTSFTLTIISSSAGSGSNINQIPSALAMIYYMGRIWYAQGKTASAGDIVGGPSGTPANNYLDSVLCVTENPLSLGGDGFTMPSGNDNITGFAIPQMINASLGQGLLNIGTANAIFALQVPVSRADWIAANANNQPQLFVVQQSNGFVNDWSCVGVNGDIWFQSLAPDIRSLLTAVRYFQQWGNVNISGNEGLILDYVNPSLLSWASGIYFNNYLMMTSLPTQTPYGVVHPAIIPLDFEPISTLEEQLPPNWCGQWEGLQILQLTVATFNGKQRAFATVLSSVVAGQIELWEIVINSIGDSGKRIQWQPTMPAFTWQEHSLEMELKKLVSAEMWIDQIQGVVEIFVEYSPDGSACWYPWIKFAICSAVNNAEIPGNIGYPVVQFEQGVRRPLVLPLPPIDNNDQTNRPSNIGFEFEPRVTIKGQCRLRGFFLKAEYVKRKLYEGLVGNNNETCKKYVNCPLPVGFPLLGYNAETPDSTPFIGLGFGPSTPPPLNWTFSKATAFAIATSTISQSDADQQALNTATSRAESTWVKPGQEPPLEHESSPDPEGGIIFPPLV